MPSEFTDRCMFPDHDPREDELTTPRYTCAQCGKTFESDSTEEEALKESAEMFGAVPREELANVCDDCFKEITNALCPDCKGSGKSQEFPLSMDCAYCFGSGFKPK